MTVQETLDRLGLYWKRDPDFVPVKDAATVRLNVSIGGGGVELLATWPKWYDTRKEPGGGAIDLTMGYRGHCCKVSDEAAFCLIQRPYISKTLLTRRISPRGSP